MTTLAQTGTHRHRDGWLSRSEAWLDNKGKGAWIAAMVLGFILFWPIGLALLAYMIWGKQMFGKSCRSNRKSWNRHGMSAMSTTGNSAFDAYKADTLERLEREQHEFESFLDRLREAKDKAEFDQFMDERARQAARDMDKDDEDGGTDRA
jgi:hypothetical protein